MQACQWWSCCTVASQENHSSLLSQAHALVAPVSTQTKCLVLEISTCPKRPLRRDSDVQQGAAYDAAAQTCTWHGCQPAGAAPWALNVQSNHHQQHEGEEVHQRQWSRAPVTTRPPSSAASRTCHAMLPESLARCSAGAAAVLYPIEHPSHTIPRPWRGGCGRCGRRWRRWPCW